MKPLACVAAAALTFAASPALAWGDLGHEVIAKIAYAHLTPAARAKVNALLAARVPLATPLNVPDAKGSWGNRSSARFSAAPHGSAPALYIAR